MSSVQSLPPSTTTVAHVPAALGEEIVFNVTGRICEHAVFGAPNVHVQCTHTTAQHSHFRRGQRQEAGHDQPAALPWYRIAGLGKVAESHLSQAEIGNGIDSVLLKRKASAGGPVRRAQSLVACVPLQAFSIPPPPANTISVSDRDFLVA